MTTTIPTPERAPESTPDITPESTLLPRGLTLSFLDGRVTAIPDQRLARYCAAYHEESDTIVYGGTLRSAGDDWRYDDRLISRPATRASFIARFSAVVDSWDLLTDSDEIASFIQGATRLHKAGEHHSKTPVTFRSGTAFHRMPMGPWSATPDGILDHAGILVYTRIKGELDVAPPPPPAAESDHQEGIVTRELKKLFQLGRRRKES